jgi:hypothetical protein
MRIVLLVLALGLPALASAAKTTSADGAGYSIGDSRTIGQGHAVVYGVVGYPTLGIGYLTGVGDGLDLAGDVQINFHANFLTFGPWARFNLYDDEGIAFSARFRLNGLLDNIPSRGFGDVNFALAAVPGIGMSAELNQLTNFTVNADIPFLFPFVSNSKVAVLIDLTAGVDRYVPKLNAAFGLFVGVAPTLTPATNDVGFNAGVRGSFGL